MASFTWVKFLERYRIPYSTRGPNTPRGAVSIHCPLCGDADQSDHMVLWAQGSWRCWRNHNHGGRHPAALVRVLIGCSMLEAHRITDTTSTPSRGDINAFLAAMTRPPVAAPPRVLEMPPEFRPLREEWACRPFTTYLRERGIARISATLLHKHYDLHYCTRGPFKGRVILPVYYKGKLISWTGRTIYPAEQVRYKSLTTDWDAAEAAGLKPALAPINHYLPWWDKLDTPGTKRLVLVEGPLDALVVNELGAPDVVATCWMGSEPTAQQIALLQRLAPRFSKCWIISDADMPQKAYHIAAKLAPLAFSVAVLPQGVDDPAELHSRRQLLSILR